MIPVRNTQFTSRAEAVFVADEKRREGGGMSCHSPTLNLLWSTGLWCSWAHLTRLEMSSYPASEPTTVWVLPTCMLAMLITVLWSDLQLSRHDLIYPPWRWESLVRRWGKMRPRCLVCLSVRLCLCKGAARRNLSSGICGHVHPDTLAVNQSWPWYLLLRFILRVPLASKRGGSSFAASY